MPTSDTVTVAAEPGEAADWQVVAAGEDPDARAPKNASQAYVLSLPAEDKALAVVDGALTLVAGDAGDGFAFHHVADDDPSDDDPNGTDCANWPEVTTNTSGLPERPEGQPRRRGRGLLRGPRPRHGLRVPRRRAALRPAVAPLRRRVRAAGLPRGRAGLQPDRRDRAGQLRPVQLRPRRLAHLHQLARRRPADPRAVLLEVAAALVRGRAAPDDEPAGREHRPVPAVPPEEELLQRDGLGAAAGPPPVRAAGLHRRPVRRPRRGLVPHRHHPGPGPRASSTAAGSPS